MQNHGWEIFEGWGLHLYVGMFGAGKTSTLVHDAYAVCAKYPQVSILTNFALYNFPAHTQILPLRTVNDILNAPDNTLVLIDEIGTVFNSRDFMGGKGVPTILSSFPTKPHEKSDTRKQGKKKKGDYSPFFGSICNFVFPEH